MSRRSTRVVSKSNLEGGPDASVSKDNDLAVDHLSDVGEESTDSKTLKNRKKRSSAKHGKSGASQKVKSFRGKLKQLP